MPKSSDDTVIIHRKLHWGVLSVILTLV